MKKNNLKNYLMEFPNYLSMLLFAFFMMLASPILVDMGKYFGVTPEDMNIITTFFLAGEVIGMLLLIFLNRVLSRKKIIISTYILMIPTLTGLILTESLTVFYLLYFAMGVYLGIIFMNTNLSMLEGNVENKDSIVNLGHGFFAAGALTSPLISSSFVNRQINWKLLYVTIIVLAIVSLTAFLFTNRKKSITKMEERNKSPVKEVFKDRKRNIYMGLTTILMLFYVMSEVTVFSWAPTFFRIEKLFDLYSASLVATVFWLGILIGRLLISVLSYKYKAGLLLIVLSFVSLGGLALAIFPTGQVINFIGAGLIGLGFSGIPPLLISSAGRIFGAGKDISLTILFVVGISFGTFIPFIIKSIAERSYILSMVIVLIFMAVFLLFVIVRKIYRNTLRSR